MTTKEKTKIIENGGLVVNGLPVKSKAKALRIMKRHGISLDHIDENSIIVAKIANKIITFKLIKI